MGNGFARYRRDEVMFMARNRRDAFKRARCLLFLLECQLATNLRTESQKHQSVCILSSVLCRWFLSYYITNSLQHRKKKTTLVFTSNERICDGIIKHQEIAHVIANICLGSNNAYTSAGLCPVIFVLCLCLGAFFSV